MKKNVVTDAKLVSYCGLYCAACGKFQNEKCPGCLENEKASWCKIRTCCQTNNYRSCADCTQFSDVMDCKKFNNIISKVFSLVFRSDRAACLAKIKEVGYVDYAAYMAEKQLVTIKK